MRHLLKIILEKNLYKVIEANDGDEALACLKKSSDIALIVTDIKMPQRDGMELLKTTVEKYPDVKVILITAFGEMEQYLDAMNMGAFEYLNKPFKNQQLLDMVKLALKS
ncbi:MAG TPA: response regulator, partial [Candidatus Sumerlaeota bacterium]|nr:response regulator [Candidatus Sumerlaeota bacterium]